MFALIDADAFYCSCEILFRPALRGRPLVVLSNGDGCVVSRTEEAKRLGVKMGQPMFQLRDLVRKNGLIALSSNYEYYGDISDRFMTIAAGLGPKQEVYSIDECWCGDLEGVRDLTRRAHAIRNRIQRWIGIGSGVGLAPSKTLAKLCNHVAKSASRKPGSYPGELSFVCNWVDLDVKTQQLLLSKTEVGDVWGIGRKLAPQLLAQGVRTAWDLARMPPTFARANWGLNMERTVHELNGISCIPLEESPPPRQQVAVTRSFGKPVSDLPPLVEAISSFTSSAAEKLRKADLRAGSVLVFIRTSPFRKSPSFYRTTVLHLVSPTSDTTKLLEAALRGLVAIFEPDYLLAKAGVILMDLTPSAMQQEDLLAETVPKDQSSLMEAMDVINSKFGRGTVHLASTGREQQNNGGWRPKQQLRTPRYTTRFDEIPVVRA